MFDNIGQIIKVVGKVLFWLSIASGLLLFVVIANNGSPMIGLLYGIGTLVGGIVSSFLFIGFGQLIEDVGDIKYKVLKDLK